jgi:hypothetical protein
MVALFNRRHFLKLTGGTLALLGLPGLVRAADNASGLATAIRESDLIYLTPIKSNGEESQCQAEIWFAADGRDMFVVTGTDTWRARAPRMGLAKARVWVGDLGVWTGTDGKYKNLPNVDTDVSVIEDKQEQERVLELFGDKYTMEWLVWGRRFRNGLEDGSRTMLRYRPTA